MPCFHTNYFKGMDEDDEEVVPLPNVNSAILRKVIQWATYHKDDPPPPEDDDNKEKRTDDISSWDADFLKVDQGPLFELILVSATFVVKYYDEFGLIFAPPKLVGGQLLGHQRSFGCDVQDCGQHDQRKNS